MEFQFFSWAQGFMAGNNLSNDAPQSNQTLISAEDQMYVIRVLCEADPSNFYFQAASALHFALRESYTDGANRGQVAARALAIREELRAIETQLASPE